MNKLIFLCFLFLTACPDFEKIQADVFLFNAEKSRIERKLKNGSTEFIRANNPAIENYRAIHKEDLKIIFEYCTKGKKIEKTYDELDEFRE